MTGFAQDGTGVDVALSDGRSLRAEYLVGCDGGRSPIRKAAGMDLTRSDGHALYLVQVDLDPSPSLAELGSRRLQGDPVG